MLGVGVMRRLGVAAACLLGESLGVAALESALGPGVAVGVQCHAADFQPLTTLLEFRGTVAGADGAQIGKERAGLGATLEDGGDFIAKADQGGLDSGAGLQLLPAVGDGASIPIN